MHSNLDQLEGRNIVIEALKRNRRMVTKVFLDERAKRDHKIRFILEQIAQKNIPVKKMNRHQLDKMSRTGVHNGVIAYAEPLPEWSTKAILNHILYEKRKDPFLVVVDEVQYEHNLGAILRSSMGAGVDGVFVPVKRGKGLTPVVHRVSMGGSEEVPLIREGISSSLAQIKRAGIPIVGADMSGIPLWSINLTGSVAIVLGGESKGLTSTVKKKCDVIASIPLAHDLDSLNVSVTAGIMMFEKCRQDRELLKK